jgi:hypothetical protein
VGFSRQIICYFYIRLLVVSFIPQTQHRNINTSHKETAKLNYTNEVIRASQPLDIHVQKHVYILWLCVPKSLQEHLWTGVIITATFPYYLHWSAEHDWTQTETRCKAPIRIIKMEAFCILRLLLACPKLLFFNGSCL